MQFLNKYLITDYDRFDYDIVALLEKYWDNHQNEIDLIYESIDDILLFHIKDKSFDYTQYRHLILGDFLFSILCCSIIDPMILNLSIYRHIYFHKIEERLFIYKDLFNFNNKYILIHQKLLLALQYRKVVTKYTIRSYRNGSFFSETVIILKGKIDNINNYIFNISYYCYHIILINNIYYTVSSFRNLCKTLRISSNMVIQKIDLSGIIKANMIPYIIDNNLYKINKQLIDEELTNLFKKLNCENFEEYVLLYHTLITKRYSKKKNSFNEDEKIMYKNFLNLYTKIISLIIFQNKSIYNRKIYMPCFCDNRGRQYYGSLLSPTFNTTIRSLLIFYNKILDYKNLGLSLYYNKILKYKNLISNYNIDNDNNKYILLILFLELGKLFCKTENNSCSINTEDFILEGIKEYNKKENNLKFKERIQANNSIYHIDCFLNKTLQHDIMIIKDCTASGLQNFGILCGYKENTLKYLNLDGENWYDTYKYLINMFIFDEEYKNRKYWKKTIMTLKYNATWYSCFMYFIDALSENNIIYKELNHEKKKYLIDMHKNFYMNAKKHIINDLYINSKMNENTLIKFEYTKKKILYSKEYKINYKHLRDKYIRNEYSSEYDKYSSDIGLEANNMHYLDSLLVKEILQKYDVITIHDCFCIRLCELHNVMDSLNKYYSKYIGENKYSIHIIK